MVSIILKAYFFGSLLLSCKIDTGLYVGGICDGTSTLGSGVGGGVCAGITVGCTLGDATGSDIFS